MLVDASKFVSLLPLALRAEIHKEKILGVSEKGKPSVRVMMARHLVL
jgi:hypothetical protein